MSELTIEHKGSIIHRDYGSYYWYHPDYAEADLVGEDWKTTGCGSCSTISECKQEIDEMLEEFKVT